MSFDSSSLLPIAILAIAVLWFGYSRLSAYIAKQPEGTMKLWARNAAPWAMSAIGGGIMVSAGFALDVAWATAYNHTRMDIEHTSLDAQIALLDTKLQLHVDGTIDLNGQETNHADLYNSLIEVRGKHIEVINSIPSVDDYRTAKETFIAFIFLFMIGAATLFYGIYMAFEVRRITCR